MLGVGGVAIVGATRSGSEAIRLAKELQPDVVLADIDLGRPGLPAQIARSGLIRGEGKHNGEGRPLARGAQQ